MCVLANNMGLLSAGNIARHVTLTETTPSIQPLKSVSQSSGLLFVEYTTPWHRPVLKLKTAHHIQPDVFMSSEGSR